MTAVSKAVLRLLRVHIDSVEKLDVLLSLGATPARSTSIVDLARLARLPPGVTRRLAGELEASGLVVFNADLGARLLPSRQSDRIAVEQLLEAHRHDRQAVLDALLGKR